MSRPSPQARYLLRASAALVLLSAVWWLVLLNPLLFGLRHVGDFLGSIVFGQAACDLISETPSGDWNICLPAHGTVSDQAHPSASRITSVEFEIARSGPIAFTFGLPVCWALLLAASDQRRSWRVLALATGVTAAVEIVLFLVFARTYGYASQGEFAAAQDAARKWFNDFSLYVELNVMPALAPFIVAITVDRRLRQSLLGSVAPEPKALRRTIP